MKCDRCNAEINKPALIYIDNLITSFGTDEKGNFVMQKCEPENLCRSCTEAQLDKWD